ncbi:MAG: hypothetical protein J3R72DRAFT_370413, partial [Linnemannia gamsii]
PTRVCFAILAIIITVSQAETISIPAVKDSTILSSQKSCLKCPESSCSKCTFGHESTIRANSGGPAYSRALVGFKLPIPSSSVIDCAIQFPAFTQPLENAVTVTIAQAASSNWDEGTVDFENAPESGVPFTHLVVPKNGNIGPIDITHACKRADSNGQISVFVGTEFGRIVVQSKESGSPSILSITYT